MSQEAPSTMVDKGINGWNREFDIIILQLGPALIRCLKIVKAVAWLAAISDGDGLHIPHK